MSPAVTPLNPTVVKQRILQKAAELGFDDCRVTTALPPASADRFTDWLAQERHGGMQYLARNAPKRVDPQLVLPGVRSIVCLALSYHDGSRPGPAGPGALAGETGNGRGVVARYARHADYHDVLAAPLKELSAFMDGLGGPGTRSLWYVDTGPVLERDLAQRAGLGFVGKHTNVIHPRLGNWLFLAEILTTLELEPDGPARNRCGTCTRCLDACPTGALPAPFQLDARRCISYLTIELKGSIPVELRPLLGRRIYGCDDCLEACPWNRFAVEAGRLMSSQRRVDLAEPDLLELLALDDAGFKARFAGTPILRTKRRGLLRNVCVALGNIGSVAALLALERALQDPEPLIVEHAAWAIAAIRNRGENALSFGPT
jgi:epoxyqueuosine reductase